jgi:hypothetical protein
MLPDAPCSKRLLIFNALKGVDPMKRIRNTHGLVVSVLIFVAVTACQSRSPEITTNPVAPAQQGADDWNDPNDESNGNDWGDAQKAQINAQLNAADLVNYLDPNSAVTYQFKYLSTDKNGDLKFANGVANLELKDLTVGQSGTLTLNILENGEAKLKGTIQNLTLKAGLNDINLKLEPVNGGGGGGGGGGDSATVRLTVTMPGSTGGGGGGGAGGGSGGVQFAQVKRSAEDFCIRCHPTADQEDWWTGKLDRTVDALKRAMDGSGALPMPMAGSPEANQMLNQDKQVLLKFLGG